MLENPSADVFQQSSTEKSLHDITHYFLNKINSPDNRLAIRGDLQKTDSMYSTPIHESRN